MALRRIPLAEGEFYHIYNRGNSKQIIFREDRDYIRFQQLLYIANGTEAIAFREIAERDDIYEFNRGEQLVSIGAYCLMPNHFHLLITPLVENGISRFMKKLGTGYSMYFNKKYERTGSLFEGRYKAQHAAEDTYLKYLFSYIHLNPVKLLQSDWRERGIQDRASAFVHLEKYRYSSFPEYDLVERKENALINTERFPQYFVSREQFRAELLDWITFTPYAE